MPERRFTIKLTVLEKATQRPLPGIRCEVWDRDTFFDDFLAEGRTDQAGECTVEISEARYREWFLDHRPDVYFKAFDAEGRLLRDTRDDVIHNLRSRKRNVVIEIELQAAEPVPPETDVAIVLAIHDAAPQTPQQIQESSPNLYPQLVARALASLRETLTAHFSDSSEELRTHIESIDVRPVAGSGQPIKDFLRATLEPENIPDLTRREGMLHINRLQVAETFEGLLQPSLPIGRNPIFQTDLRLGATHKIGAFAELEGQTIQQLAESTLDIESITDGQLREFIESNTLTEESAQRLGLAANLFKWSGARLDLVAAVRAHAHDQQGNPARNLRDVARSFPTRAAIIELLDRAQIALPEGVEREAFASSLLRPLERLFPHEIFKAQFRPPEPEVLAQNLETIAPLIAHSAALFGPGIASPSFAGIEPSLLDDTVNAYNELSKVANRHSGLEVAAVLNDPEMTPAAKATEVRRRVDLLTQFHALNPTAPFLTMDYMSDNDALAALDFGNMSDDDKAMVLADERTNQRIWNVARDAEHTLVIREAGFQAASDIVLNTPRIFIARTNLPEDDAHRYMQNARDNAAKAGAAFGLIADEVIGGFRDMAANNVSPDIEDYLHRLPGFAEFFGNQGGCRCKHCQSIISPAAYFVDLMEYIDINITRETFGSEKPLHGISLWQRRPDLWSMPLSCDDTEKLIPYLVIINEVLENYIYRANHNAADGPIADVELPDDRAVTVDYVYRELAGLHDTPPVPVRSFHQPFVLPLERLTVYLSHFPLTRAEIAATVLEGVPDTETARALAILGISQREYDLIAIPSSDRDSLLAVFSLERRHLSGTEENSPEVEHFLRGVPIDRAELSELIETWFVTSDTGAGALAIRPDRRSSQSVQNDVEYIDNTSLGVLDRIHRFIRLWKLTPWSIGEFDLILRHLGPEPSDGTLEPTIIATLLSIQKRLKLSTEELCALLGAIPREATRADRRSLFDRLFNPPHYDRSPPEIWGEVSPEPIFVHPAFGDEPSDAVLVAARRVRQQRLLAGLGIDDESLIVLLRHFHEAAGTSLEDGVTLGADTLSLLYLHARLAKSLGMAMADFVQFLSLADEITGGLVRGLADVEAALRFFDWWKSTWYILDDLAFLAGYQPRDSEPYPPAEAVVEDVIAKARDTGALVFADTVFALINGVTEEQSRRIIAANRGDGTTPPIFAQASTNAFRIAPSVDLADFSIAGISIAEGTTPDWDEAVLRAHLISLAGPAAPTFTDTVFDGIGGATEEDSRTIFEANRILFESIVDETSYWLTEHFTDGTTSFVIPAPDPPLSSTEIPLSTDAARSHLAGFQAGAVVTTLLAAAFGISVEKMQEVLAVSGQDLQHGALAQQWTIAVQTGNTAGLSTSVEQLQRLVVLFSGRRFSAEAVEFVADHAGGVDAIIPFATTPGVADPTLADARTISRVHQALTRDSEDLEALGTALSGFDHARSRFSEDDDVIVALSELAEADKGLITSLNRSTTWPADDPTTPETENRAVTAFLKMQACVELAKHLGVGGDILPLIIPIDPSAADEFVLLDQAVDALYAAFRTKYATEEEWESKFGPFEDRLRERKRDALSDYIIRTLTPNEDERDRFKNSNDLYHWFLLDTELEGCARTSRVVAGIASLQLYIQRCLMNLEQNRNGSVHALVNAEGAAQWVWRKNYRVWEAARKVFLWPENYLQPALRDNQSELFEETIAQLLQQDLNDQAVHEAYTSYVEGFCELADLRYAGAYHRSYINSRGGQGDVMYLLGTGGAADKRSLYCMEVRDVYRSTEPKWGTWRKIAVPIPSERVSPVCFRGRLFVFWIDWTSRPETLIIDGTSVLGGYLHKRRLNYVVRNANGSWSTSNDLSLFDAANVSDPLASDADLLAFQRTFDWSERQGDTLVTIRDGSVESDLNRRLRGQLSKMLRNEPSLLSSPFRYFVELPKIADVDGSPGCIIAVPFDQPVVQDLFKPEYSDAPHLEADDEYSLNGYRWDQVYLTDGDRSGLVATFGSANAGWTDRAVDLFNHAVIARRLDGLIVPNGARRRLSGRDGRSVGVVFVPLISPARPHAQATEISERGTVGGTTLLDGLPSGTVLSIVNGSPHDENEPLSSGILQVDGGLFFLYALPLESWVPYGVRRIGTSLGTKLRRVLFEDGVGSLLSLRTQQSLKEDPLPFTFHGRPELNFAQLAIDNPGPDFRGSMGTYMREVWFHTPFLIADHLNSQGEFVKAQLWLHHIFDPTHTEHVARDSDSDRSDHLNRMWQYLEFRNHNVEGLHDQLNDAEAVSSWERDPFNPHAVARQRLGAYKKSVLLKYIDNLLDWGDHLFAQDTMESINEASLLYVMAADLLGERPAEFGDCRRDVDLSYESVIDSIRSCRRSFQEVENLFNVTFYGLTAAYRDDYSDLLAWFVAPPTPAIEEAAGDALPMVDLDPYTYTSEHFASPQFESLQFREVAEAFVRTKAPDLAILLGTSIRRQACVFCIPANKDLLAYWDRVEDRLFKIRNCQNISGVRRELPLFAREIDPRLLVRARAAGLSLEDVLDAGSGDLPPYRFSFLLPKAKEFASALQGFGAALLSALERKDAEELAQLRLVHQDQTLKLGRQLRDGEVRAAEASLEALGRRRETVVARRDYYGRLIDQGLSDWEHAQGAFFAVSDAMKGAAGIASIIAGAGALFPRLLGMAFSTPAASIKDAGDAWADVFNSLSDVARIGAERSGLQAGYDRRRQGWEFARDQAALELMDLEQQIVAADIRKEISVRSQEIHELSITQLAELAEFYEEKFSNVGLYSWLSTTVQRLYREAYQNAISMARLAERAFRFEQGDDTTPLLSGSYWNGQYAGLLAGDQLMNDLRSMERRYIETHYRCLEVDQAFSLAQIDPNALLRLKATGTCTFTIPELYFDLFYPGQYDRRLKSARLTIPCVTGPYTNVSATLTLLGSYLRKDPVRSVSHVAADRSFVPPTRSVAIATSTAQNDAGVFRLDFRDERYMPFEGAGAIDSEWELSLPRSFRTFDYTTINDVILHLSYTAKHSESLRAQVEEGLDEANSLLEDTLTVGGTRLYRLFSMRQEFSSAFHQLVHSPADTPVTVELGERHFPMFLQGRSLEIVDGSALLLEIDPDRFGEDEEPNITIETAAGGSTLGGSGRAFAQRFPPVRSVYGHQLSGLGTINPSRDPLQVTLTITDRGNLAPSPEVPSDPSAIDDTKLKDLYLYVEYRLAGR